MQSEIRDCEDIGMYVLDRRIQDSCTCASEFCKEFCFNVKLLRAFDCEGKDIRNEEYWKDITIEEFEKHLSRRHKYDHNRFRFASRGEFLGTIESIEKLASIIKAMPERDFWIPTRSWRKPELWSIVLKLFKPLKNAYIKESTDPTACDNPGDYPAMFFGDNEECPHEKPFKCPKTWKDKKGHCGKCKGGCFNHTRNIWLKQH